MALTYFSGGFESGIGNLAWPILFALGIGVFIFLQTLWKLKRNVLKNIPVALALVKVDRAAWLLARWPLIDDYGAQLVSRGFSHAGDYAIAAPTPGFEAVASIYFDEGTTTAVEIQHILSVPHAALAAPGVAEVHFSIASILAGRVALTVTDHTMQASHYLLGHAESVAASYPGLNLMGLLDKHATLLAQLSSQTGHTVAAGLNVERYVLLQRERHDAARQRIEKMNGYKIATLVDEFERAAATQWSLAPEFLRALQVRPLAEIEQRADAQHPPPVGAPSITTAPADAPAPDAIHNTTSADAAVLKPQIDSYANWFYWISGLSAVNALATMFGSNWGFAMGLGATLILSQVGSGGVGALDVSMVIVVVAWALCLSLVALFASRPWPAPGSRDRGHQRDGPR